MGVSAGTRTISDGLVLALDAANTRSYPGSGTTWFDLSDRGNNGTLTNGPSFVRPTFTEPFDGAGSVYFDGNGDRIYCTPPNLTGQFTIEGWWYATAFASTPVFFGNWGTGCLLRISGSNIQWYTRGFIGGISGASTFTTGQWYHLAVSRDSSNVHRVFVNGVQVTSATNADSITMTNFCIGSENTSSIATDIWNGYISNFRILKGTALYTSNFTPKRESFVTQSSPYTSLLTCQNGTIRDASPNNFTITRDGNVTPVSYAPYISFDGTNDYVTIPDSDDFTLGSENFTIDAWIYPTATGSFPSFISKYAGSSTNSSFFFSLGNSNQTLEFYLHNGVSGQQAILQSGTVSLNAWNYVAAVRVGNRVATYLNGVEVASTTWTYSVYDANVSVTVGSGQYNGAYYFNGRISNTRILKGKGLTAAEVSQNYQNTKSRYGL